MQSIEFVKKTKKKGFFTLEEAFNFLSAQIFKSEDIIEFIHQGSYECPRCQNSIISAKQLKTFKNGGRIQCNRCGKFFNYKNNTIIDGSSFSPNEVFLLAIYLYFNLPSQEIAKRLDIDKATVCIWKNKFEILKQGEEK